MLFRSGLSSVPSQNFFNYSPYTKETGPVSPNITGVKADSSFVYFVGNFATPATSAHGVAFLGKLPINLTGNKAGTRTLADSVTMSYTYGTNPYTVSSGILNHSQLAASLVTTTAVNTNTSTSIAFSPVTLTGLTFI